MKGCFAFQQGRGGGFVFQMRGALFLSEGECPMGGISFDGRLKKSYDGGHPAIPPQYGKSC